VLVWYYIILVFWVDRLVVCRDVDFVVGELVFAEIFEEVCVAGASEVDVGVGGVFGLWGECYLGVFKEGEGSRGEIPFCGLSGWWVGWGGSGGAVVLKLWMGKEADLHGGSFDAE
jgi:hypothetical protein